MQNITTKAVDLEIKSPEINMTVNPSGKIIKREVRLKSIILPNEHGSWGFLFEPLVVSIIVAPSIASVWIALLVIGAFLTRQPLKVLLADKLAKRKLPQTALALRYSIIFGTICFIGFVGSLLSLNFQSFIPFLLIIPLAIYQIYCDATKQTRRFLPEITGAIAISSSSAVIALAGGWEVLNAYSLWAILVARLIPSIIYVRSRLRLEKGKDFSLAPVTVSNFIAVGAIGLLAWKELIPWLTLPIFIVLMIRAFWGLSPFRRKVKAMRIGVWEVIYGVLTVLSVILGYYLKI
jgi:YwiC-like protein